MSQMGDLMRGNSKEGMYMPLRHNTRSSGVETALKHENSIGGSGRGLKRSISPQKAVANDNVTAGVNDEEPGGSGIPFVDELLANPGTSQSALRNTSVKTGEIVGGTDNTGNGTMKIDTKGFCMLCYKKYEKRGDDGAAADGKEGEHNHAIRKKEVSSRCLKLLIRYLNMDIYCHSVSHPNQDEISQSLKKDGDRFEIVTCESCFTIMDAFCTAYEQRERAQLQLDWNVSKLQSIMKAAENVTPRVNQFRKKVLEGPNCMSNEEKTAMDGFKREFFKKCKSKRYPRVVVQKPIEMKGEKKPKAVLLQRHHDLPNQEKVPYLPKSGSLHSIEVLNLRQEISLKSRNHTRQSVTGNPIPIKSKPVIQAKRRKPNASFPTSRPHTRSFRSGPVTCMPSARTRSGSGPALRMSSARTRSCSCPSTSAPMVTSTENHRKRKTVIHTVRRINVQPLKPKSASASCVVVDLCDSDEEEGNASGSSCRPAKIPKLNIPVSSEASAAPNLPPTQLPVQQKDMEVQVNVDVDLSNKVDASVQTDEHKEVNSCPPSGSVTIILDELGEAAPAPPTSVSVGTSHDRSTPPSSPSVSSHKMADPTAVQDNTSETGIGDDENGNSTNRHFPQQTGSLSSSELEETGDVKSEPDDDLPHTSSQEEDPLGPESMSADHFMSSPPQPGDEGYQTDRKNMTDDQSTPPPQPQSGSGDEGLDQADPEKDAGYQSTQPLPLQPGSGDQADPGNDAGDQSTPPPQPQSGSGDQADPGNNAGDQFIPPKPWFVEEQDGYERTNNYVPNEDIPFPPQPGEEVIYITKDESTPATRAPPLPQEPDQVVIRFNKESGPVVNVSYMLVRTIPYSEDDFAKKFPLYGYNTPIIIVPKMPPFASNQGGVETTEHAEEEKKPEKEEEDNDDDIGNIQINNVQGADEVTDNTQPDGAEESQFV